MLRRSLVIRAAQCLYNALGVPPTATTAEIKEAFRERAKKTHPDIAGSADAARSFRDMVDAYRVLRDPKKRAEYDREVAAKAQARGSAPWPGGGAPHGYGSEAFRANLYNYPMGASAQQGPMQGDAQFNPAGIRTEYAAIGAVMLAGVWLLLPGGKSDRSNYIDPDPYPARRPGSRLSAGSTGASKQKSVAIEDPAASPPAGQVPAAAATASSGPALSGENQVGDELVSAFYNPFAEKWQRIPPGYEPPGAMDLTAWHKKRTDPVEWARLFAEGKLSQIIPRGGLQVRFRPAWDTHEPTIIKDPHTGKTVQMSGKLPPRDARPACEVEF